MPLQSKAIGFGGRHSKSHVGLKSMRKIAGEEKCRLDHAYDFKGVFIPQLSDLESFSSKFWTTESKKMTYIYPVNLFSLSSRWTLLCLYRGRFFIWEKKISGERMINRAIHF